MSIACVLSGDANLGRILNTADFNRLSGSFGLSGRGLAQEECDYRGPLTSNDVDVLAANYSKGRASPGAGGVSDRCTRPIFVHLVNNLTKSEVLPFGRAEQRLFACCFCQMA